MKEREHFEPYRHSQEVQEVIDLEKSKSALLALPGSPLRESRLIGIEFALGKKGLISELHMDIDVLMAQAKTCQDEILRLNAIIKNHNAEKTDDLWLSLSCERKCPFRTISID